MSLILPSTITAAAAPSQPGNPPSNATARCDEQGQNNPGSFGEALSRSLEPAGEITGKPTDKAATPPPARRQAGSHKTDPEDLVNAMALSFAPLESRIVKAAPTGGAGTAPDNTGPGAATALPTDLLANTPAPTDGSTAAPAANTDTDAGAQTALKPALAAAGQEDIGQTTLQTRLNPVGDSAAIQLDPGKIAGQPTAPDTGFADQSSKRDDKAANKPDEMRDASAGLTPADTHSTAKLAAAATAPAVETAAITITASQAPADATLSASAVLPTHPVNAAAQGPAGVSAPNTPMPVVTPSLAPEVGSSEWGKALGRQMIQMGHAGHQVAELQINPAGLGPLKVTLSMNNHQVEAMFLSAHSSVRAAVEAALPQLRTSLADSGISLGNTSVNADSPQQQQTAFAHSQSGHPGHRSYGSHSMADTATPSARPVTEPLRRSNGINVDTYA